MNGTRAPVPVALDIAGPVRSQVHRVVEGALGWQVVAVDDPVLPPRYVIVDPPRAAGHANGGVPVVLLTVPEDDPAATARAARHATAVLEGVPDAAVLEQLAVRTNASTARRVAWCTVAAAAGGVGATTVATAIAGLRAWRHGPTLLGVLGPDHQDGAPLVAVEDLASPAVWAAATPTVGIDGLRVVRLGAPGVVADVGSVPVVLEVGQDDATADVLVVRPDRAGLAAVSTATGAVVVVGRGPVEQSALRRAAASRTTVACPWSARVAAAAAAGRMPTDLPGAWLRPLSSLVTDLEARRVVP